MGDTTAQLQIPVSPFQFAAAGLIALSALMHLYLATSRRAGREGCRREVGASRERIAGGFSQAMSEALIGFAAMFLLMSLRVPIALSMGAVGFVGIGLMRSWPAAVSSTATEFLDIAGYTLSVVPLFVLMGNFVTRAGMSRELYRAAYAFIGHWRGGLAMSTIAACAGFGAICGSSIATAATMARVSMPEMRRFKYHDSFAAGSIAAGGTLGILIPPSVIMVIYGIMTTTSIGALFAAGFIPGLLALTLYMLAAAVVTARNPELGPRGERSSWSGAAARPLKDVWAVLLLFLRGHRRHVRRLVHADGGGRRRRLRRLPVRLGASHADLGGPAGRAGGIGAHHRHAVHHRDRRVDLQQLRQLHHAAERPADVRHAVPDQPDHGDHRDLRDLRGARHARWKSCP